MKIGLLGTGLMGQAMVEKLLQTNLPVTVYNRTSAKLETLKEAGAIIANTPLEVIKNTDVIILMLSDRRAIETVLLSINNLPFLGKKTIIQMGTIAPSESKAIEEKIVAAGGEYLEAPVLGSIPEVKTGKLLVMVGATEEQFKRWLELLKVFSLEPKLIGKVGTAAALKLALNQLIAGLTASFGLSLALVQSQGVEVEEFMEILRQSALYAPTFDKKLSKMCDRNYNNPNFPTKHLLKDTVLFLQEAEENNLNIDGLIGVKNIIQKAIDLGFGEEDYSAIFQAIVPKSNY